MSGFYNMLLGAAGPRLSAGGGTIDVTVSFAIELQADGDLILTGDAVPATTAWIAPVAYAPGTYHARVHINSGASPVSGAAVDTDISIAGGTAAWNWTSATNFTLTIKAASGGATLSTGVYSIT